MLDAAIVGAGPNGLAAAHVLAARGLSVEVFEKASEYGGASRTEAWGSGYWSDVGAAVHPMALASPYFASFGVLDDVAFAVPEASFAHVVSPSKTVIAWHSLDRTVEGLGEDGRRWRSLAGPLVESIDRIVPAALAAPMTLVGNPREAYALARAALKIVGGAGFEGESAQALLAGVSAHSAGRQNQIAIGAAGAVLLAMAHAAGWPIPLGGSGAVTGAIARKAQELGVVIHTGVEVVTLEELPDAHAYLLDTSGPDLLAIAGDRVSARYARAVRSMRTGAGVSKVDLALSGPIPWRDPALNRTGTVHFGGTRASIASAELEVASGRHSGRPVALVSQPSLFDESRAEHNEQIVWGYVHVPAGSDVPQTEALLNMLEGQAPGVRDLVIASREQTASQLAIANPTLASGDLGSGAITTRQILARPVFARTPWRAGASVYLCSAASAPGPGVHGMAGFGAANAAIRDHFA